MTELESAREAVAKGLARCKATLSALRADAPVDDLPRIAADTVAQLDAAVTSLGRLHTKAEQFALQAYTLGKENRVMLEFLETLAAFPTVDERARATREMLKAMEKGAPITAQL